MCLIMLSWQPQQETRLIVAANRDEFFSRPTESAHYWPDAPHIFAGRDKEFGGSWMGLSRAGRFAAVTNLRQQPHSGEQSRGNLVRDFLLSEQPAETFLAELESAKSRYRPFNFIASDGQHLCYTDNVSPGWETAEAGEIAVGNVPRHEENKKRAKGLSDFRTCLENDSDAAALIAMLQDSEISEACQDSQLRELSRRFVSLPEYGTRTSSVIFQMRSGESLFWEQNYDNNQRRLPVIKHLIQSGGQG
ncbi:NRDE family protein [Spongiibacter taiwanensis]